MTTPSPALFITDYLLAQPGAWLDGFSDTEPTWGRLILRDGLPTRLNGTGLRALTVAMGTGSATPFAGHAYSSFVQIRFYADHTRDQDGLVASEDGVDKAWAMFGPVDHALYQTYALQIPTYPDTWVQSSRGTLPQEFFDQDQDLPYVACAYDVAILASV